MIITFDKYTADNHLFGKYKITTQGLKKQSCIVFTNKFNIELDLNKKRVIEEWKKLYCN